MEATDMAEQIYFEDVHEGQVISPLSLAVSRVQMFFFSAATYNGHRIHYDQTWATQEEGYRDILVHGPLQVALLARAVTDWIGPAGKVLRYSTQNRGVAFPGDELRFVGSVERKQLEGDAHVVELSLQGLKIEDGDEVLLMPGTATVTLPSKEAS
jgi:hydroxyacyl-ACP dehydratase HTD2-like protein with hotdog domain